MPAPELVPLRRWLVSLARFPINRLAHLPRPWGFPLLRTRPLQSGVWRLVKCFPRESTLLITRAPSPQGRRSKRRGVTVMSAKPHDCSGSWLTCHAGLHQSVRRPPASHAPRLLLHAAFRYPRSLRTARPGRTIAADCSASSPHSAALMGFKYPFAVLSRSSGVLAFPRC
jgi:hypothetical protein